MKTKNLFYLFLSSIILLTGFSSCNDDTKTLNVIFSDIHVKVDENFIWQIFGNDGYVLTVSDETVFTASESNSLITVKPIKTGKATLTITDSDGQIAKIAITVQQPYMAFGVVKIENSISANTATTKLIQDNIQKEIILEEGYLYDLTRIDSKPYSSYKTSWSSTVASTGTYNVGSDSLQLKSLSGIEFGYKIEKNAFGKVFYDYFVSQGTSIIPSGNQVFNMEADLTEKYQEKYPEGEVKNVKVVVLTLLIPYRYTFAF